MIDDLPSPILQLGDARLREVCEKVTDVRDSAFRAEVRALAKVLREFRAARGFGRAIAAPQIGITKRFLVVDLGEGPCLMVNPEITWKSEELFTMWDDCMSFPSLLVRVQRHESISIRYMNDAGATVEWERLGREESELLQHEIDHLDGILATDRAIGEEPFVTRSMFEESPGTYAAKVDYTIPPPPPAEERAH
jgi:peptide deformylase